MPPKQRRRCGDVGNATSILHTGSISTTGLAELVRRLRAQSIDLDNIGRRSLRTANYDLLVRYGVVDKLPLVEGGESFEWTYLAPAAWLAALVGKSSALESIFAAALATAPCSMHRPWSLIIGFDEFAPGNKLAVHNARKCMVLSITFMELGQEAISGGQPFDRPRRRAGWLVCGPPHFLGAGDVRRERLRHHRLPADRSRKCRLHFRSGCEHPGRCGWLEDGS